MRSDLDIKEYIKELEEECNCLRDQLFTHKIISAACIIIMSVLIFVNYCL